MRAGRKQTVSAGDGCRYSANNDELRYFN